VLVVPPGFVVASQQTTLWGWNPRWITAANRMILLVRKWRSDQRLGRGFRQIRSLPCSDRQFSEDLIPRLIGSVIVVRIMMMLGRIAQGGLRSKRTGERRRSRYVKPGLNSAMFSSRDRRGIIPSATSDRRSQRPINRAKSGSPDAVRLRSNHHSQETTTTCRISPGGPTIARPSPNLRRYVRRIARPT